jgi:hypothetical protein
MATDNAKQTFIDEVAMYAQYRAQKQKRVKHPIPYAWRPNSTHSLVKYYT